MPLHLMNREQLLAYTNILEAKINMYSERDWLQTQVYIAKLKEADMFLLDMYNDDTLPKEA